MPGVPVYKCMHIGVSRCLKSVHCVKCGAAIRRKLQFADFVGFNHLIPLILLYMSINVSRNDKQVKTNIVTNLH